MVGLQQETAALEGSGRLIRSFHPVLMPGLLQTPAYAKAVFTAAHPAGRADLAEAVAARMNRQAILYEETRRFEFVLSEAGLRWRLGPTDLLLGQLDRVGVVATLPNVSLGIIPLAAELHAWHSHGFVIFAERDGEPVVHVETLTSALNVREPTGVAPPTRRRLGDSRRVQSLGQRRERCLSVLHGPTADGRPRAGGVLAE